MGYPPTYRRKKRHIVVEFVRGRPDDPIKWTKKRIKEVLGVVGLAHVIKIKEEEDKVLITVDREWACHIRAALALSKDFLIVTHVSGTLAAAKRKGYL